jgi:hypothetical protein
MGNSDEKIKRYILNKIANDVSDILESYVGI